MSTPKQLMYEKAGEKVIEELKKRHFDAYYCLSKGDAVNKVFDLISENDIVSWGGSETLETLGIQEELRKRNYKVIDRDTAESPEERKELMRLALLSDTYLMSSNAITEDGQLFNIDGNGNRVAALIYGPKQVIVVAGMNKVVKSVPDAESRVKNLAAPMNAQRFKNLKTPCHVNGTCSDCLSPDSICASMVRTRLCRPAGRIKVILVGEDLGM